MEFHVDIVCARVFICAYLCTYTRIYAHLCVCVCVFVRALEYTLCHAMISATCIELLRNIGRIMRSVTNEHISPFLRRYK